MRLTSKYNELMV